MSILVLERVGLGNLLPGVPMPTIIDSGALPAPPPMGRLVPRPGSIAQPVLLRPTAPPIPRVFVGAPLIPATVAGDYLRVKQPGIQDALDSLSVSASPRANTSLVAAAADISKGVTADQAMQDVTSGPVAETPFVVVPAAVAATEGPWPWIAFAVGLAAGLGGTWVLRRRK